jgi:hypothetical protein
MSRSLLALADSLTTPGRIVARARFRTVVLTQTEGRTRTRSATMRKGSGVPLVGDPAIGPVVSEPPRHKLSK